MKISEPQHFQQLAEFSGNGFPGGSTVGEALGGAGFGCDCYREKMPGEGDIAVMVRGIALSGIKFFHGYRNSGCGREHKTGRGMRERHETGMHSAHGRSPSVLDRMGDAVEGMAQFAGDVRIDVMERKD